MDRRDFIKATLAAGCSGLLNPLLPGARLGGLAFAAKPTDLLLNVVFLRGGADGLHLLAPIDDADYLSTRPPELRVGESGHALSQTLEPRLDFRLHSEAAALAELYRSKRLSAIHAVGITDGTRSHFVAQDLIERGLADEKRIGSEDRGWLARGLPGSDGNRINYAATAALPASLRGQTEALVAPDLNGGLTPPWGSASNSFLRSLAMTGNTLSHSATAQALNLLERVDQRLPRDEKNRVSAYQPAAGRYDGAGDLGRSLSAVARLARLEAGLAVACVDFGGWDTHEGQAGRFANQVRQLSAGLSAFHDDMAAAGRRHLTLVISEFGRRMRANKSGGTDHGHGACWLVLGDGIQGGRLFGRWPGLAVPQLDQGVDLAVTTDYRQVFAEVLRAVNGQSSDALPGFSPGKGRNGALGLLT